MMKTHELEQGTEDWFELRTGLPTGSMAKKLVTSQGKESKSLPEYAIELANDKYAGKPLDSWEGNQWTERGSELEAAARSLYEMIHNCEVTEVGFCTDDDGLYGVSPDGFVGEDGGLEIKCLKSTNHTKAIMYYEKNKKPPTDYVSQVQMQLFVTGRKWWDLMFYNEVLPELVIRIKPDPKFFEVLKTQLCVVIEERDRVYNILKAISGE